MLRERVSAATGGGDWVTDAAYHRMLGNLVVDRADVLVWLDLPVPLKIAGWKTILNTLTVHDGDRIAASSIN